MGFKRIILLIYLSGAMLPCATGQDFYKTSTANIKFFSSAPIEDIHAISNNGISVLDTRTGEIAFTVDIKTFEFPKRKMQEHFNENFMESDKYPAAAFRGKISEDLDYSQDGTHTVTVVGTLEVHGEKKKRKIPATITIKDKELELSSEFEVACEDHDIKIPKILWQNIAEIVQVTVNAHYKK